MPVLSGTEGIAGSYNGLHIPLSEICGASLPGRSRSALATFGQSSNTLRIASLECTAVDALLQATGSQLSDSSGRTVRRPMPQTITLLLALHKFTAYFVGH